MIRVEGYLTQQKLHEVLLLLPGVELVGTEVKVPDTRKRWDFLCVVNGVTTVVEFDGDQHYWNSLRIKSDIEKDLIASALGYKVVRIPYWVQLTTETVQFYLGVDTEISQDFPHGFVATKLFPASFSFLGAERFRTDLSALPMRVREQVLLSLAGRAAEYGERFVYPPGMG